MKAFPLNFLVGGVGGGEEILGWETQWATQNLSLQRISAWGNWVKKLLFCFEFIYLFIICLFVDCLCVCLLITLREQ